MRKLVFRSDLNFDCITQTGCEVRYSTAENNIVYNDKSYQVKRQRPYMQFPSNTSSLDECELAQHFYTSFGEQCGPFPRTSVVSLELSILEIYLMTGLSPLSMGILAGNTIHNVSNLTAREMGQGLTRLVNTLFMSSVAPEFIAGGMNRFNFSDPTNLELQPGNEIMVDVFTDKDFYNCDYC